MSTAGEASEVRRVGLCTGCVHGGRIAHPRGGDAYWRCARSEKDAAYPRFPKLPVIRCPGFHACPGGADPGEMP